MATSKTTAAADTGAKAKTKAADEAAPTPEQTPAAPEQPAPEGTGTDAETGNSAADAVRARRMSNRDTAATDRVPTQVFDYGDKPRELTPEQIEGQNGLPTFHQGGPISSTPNLAGRHTIDAGGRDSEYVIPDDDGFIAFIAENCKTPSTIRVWTKGQAVKRSVHDHYTGLAASTPGAATVLDPKDVVTVR